MRCQTNLGVSQRILRDHKSAIPEDTPLEYRGCQLMDDGVLAKTWRIDIRIHELCEAVQGDTAGLHGREERGRDIR